MGQKSITIILIDIGPISNNELNWKKLSKQILYKKLVYRLKTELVGIICLGKLKPKKLVLSDTVRVLKKLSFVKEEDISLIDSVLPTEFEANVLEGIIESCNLLTEDYKLKDYSKSITLISKEPYISKNSTNSEDTQQKLIRCINSLNVQFNWWGGDDNSKETNFKNFFNKLNLREFVNFEQCKDMYYIWDTQLDETRQATSTISVDLILENTIKNIKLPLVGFKYHVLGDKSDIIEAKEAELKRKREEEEGEEGAEWNYYLGSEKVPSDFVLKRLDLSESACRIHGFIPLSNIQVLHFHSSPIHFYLNSSANSTEAQDFVDFVHALVQSDRAVLVRLNHPRDPKNRNKPKILSMAMMIPKFREDNKMPYFICRLLPFQREDVPPYLIDPTPCETYLNEEPLIEEFMDQLTISENDEDGNGIDLSRAVKPPSFLTKEDPDNPTTFDDLIEYLPSKIRENLVAWDSKGLNLKQIFDKYTSQE